MRGRGAALVIGMKAGENKAKQQAAAEQQAAEAAKAQAAAAAPAPAPAPAADPTEELKKLADLHNQGIISDEEFAAAKKKALGI